MPENLDDHVSPQPDVLASLDENNQLKTLYIHGPADFWQALKKIAQSTMSTRTLIAILLR
ncbi:MAG: hypothetical protein ABFS56_15060 [Pseudomonadota bacterium]